MKRRCAPAGCVVLLASLVGPPRGAFAQDLAPPAPVAVEQTSEELPQPSVGRARIDEIRERIEALQFEQALSAIEAFLADPGWDEDERADALVLRAQVDTALGRTAELDRDYLEILRLRPAYTPDESVTPLKTLARFRKLQQDTIGRLALTVDPADAQVTLDGRLVTADGMRPLPLVAGEHTLRAVRSGFDPFEQIVAVAADQDVDLDVRLVPNARSLVVSTMQDDVEVWLDGELAGSTSRSPGNARADLTLEYLALGEHRIELRKPCHRTERLRETLSVDLLDRSPMRLNAVDLVRVPGSLTLQGGPTGASIRIDARLVGEVPGGPLELCPGEHQLELSLSGRTIWRSTESLGESESRTVRVVPRPNLVLVESADPIELPLPFAGAFNVDRLRPAERLDPSSPDGWSVIDLPQHTDLAFVRDGSGDGWLYSPVLDVVERIGSMPERLDRPGWSVAVWGLTLVDSVFGGPARVAAIRRAPSGAPALRPGNKIVSLGGIAVDDAAGARGVLRLASTRVPLEIVWTTSTGTRVSGQLEGRQSPALQAGPTAPIEAAVRAAFARVDAVCDDGAGPAALANLALLEEQFGRHTAAAATWERVRWGERSGIGEGTRQYYLGRTLERLGREAEAARAYRLAAASESTAIDDEGPAVAPAARDRLADLGLAVDPISAR